MFKQKLAALLLGVATAIGMGALAQQPPLRNFDTPATGNVTGVASSVDSEIALFSGTGGKTLKRATGTGVVHATSGVYSTAAVALATEVSGTLPIVNGGTNLTAAADDNVMVGNGTTWQTKAVPDCDDTDGNHLNYDTGANTFSCGTSSSGGGGTPGGADTQVQYNDGGAFGGEADFTWAETTNILTFGSTATPGSIRSAAGSGVDGANLNLIGGAGGATNAGGRVVLSGGAGGATSGAGGAVQLLGGVAATDGNGGFISIVAGNGVGTNRNGGNVSLSGGPPSGTGDAGNVSLTAGASAGAGVVGGSINLTGGGANGAADGGAVNINAGAPSNGGGGSVNITARNGAGTNQAGGNIVMTAGNPTGSGTQGALQFVNMTATGAQTATFTATNKPGAGTGAPTLWLRVVVSGTTYWVPLFAN